MLVWKKIIWLRKQIQEQSVWVARCGGDLAGYIAHYGDPGTPPLDANGNYQTFRLTKEQQKLFANLSPVPGQDDTFYKEHFGDGGLAIFNADINRLHSLETELSELQVRNPTAKMKADEYIRSVV